mmetsp:Transcript_2035/g.3663  ORF Transcript_2035/g.3663 Transcript_2035/m.3663 type:complete len:117 (+) Transcript_2035:1239-1589(+)
MKWCWYVNLNPGVRPKRLQGLVQAKATALVGSPLKFVASIMDQLTMPKSAFSQTAGARDAPTEVWETVHAKTTSLSILSFPEMFVTANGLQLMGLDTYAMEVLNIGVRVLAGRVHK